MKYPASGRLAIAVAALALFGRATAGAQTLPDVNLRVGILPIVDVAPLYIGMAKGYFKDEHLTIEPVPANGGGLVATAVISGDEQIGYGNVVSMMLAAAHGLPMQAVTDGSQSIADGHHDNIELYVLANGPIKTLKDFNNKTLAVNALNTISEIMIKDVLEKHGVDVSTIKFVELGMPEMGAALKSGRVDIVMETEPYLTAQKSDDARPMLEPYNEYMKRVTLATYFTSSKYAADHPDIIARFRRAMLKSLAYTTAHQDEARRIIPTYTKIDAATASSMALVDWSTSIDMPSIMALQTSMIKQGLLAKEVDLNALFPASATSGK